MSHSHRCTHDTNDLAGCFVRASLQGESHHHLHAHMTHTAFFTRVCAAANLHRCRVLRSGRHTVTLKQQIRRRRRSCARTRMFPKESQALDGRSSLVMFALRSYFQRSTTATSILSLPFSNNHNCPCATHPSRCLTCKRRMMTCHLGSGCSAPSMTPVFPASST